MDREQIVDLFQYHAPTPDHIAAINRVREASIALAVAIDENCPAGADRTAAIRKVKEAAMTANASIVLDGKAYR